MHADLVALSNVWQSDVTIDTLKAEHEGLSAALKSAVEDKAGAEQARTQAKAALDAVHGRQRATNRELDEYTGKREATRRMIDGGTAPDYDAATRQLARCTEIVDQLETRALEELEEEDAAKATLAAAEEAVATTTRRQDEARAALGARDAPLRTELAATLPKRELAWSALPADLRAPYTELRRKRRRALVNTVDGICQSCSMRVPANKVNEVALHKAVHACPGCGGFLLP